MIQTGKLLELTPFTTGPLNLGANLAQFNLVQPAMQGYNSASEKTNINTKPTGNLTAVAVTPAAGNREIARWPLGRGGRDHPPRYLRKTSGTESRR